VIGKNSTYQKTKDDKIIVEKDLQELNLSHAFVYRDTMDGVKKGQKQVRLLHIKNKKYHCKDCDRDHMNDNCIFIEYGFESGKCYK
jgi:hypothetical protein